MKRGSGACVYRPPVAGDTRRPRSRLPGASEAARATPKGIRRTAYLGIAVRSGTSSGYELRIFPKQHKYVLRRKPGGGGGFPKQGKSRAIKGVDKANVLRLKAFGNTVTAKVNRRTVAQLTDSNAGQVAGSQARGVRGPEEAHPQGRDRERRQPQAPGPEPVGRLVPGREAARSGVPDPRLSSGLPGRKANEGMTTETVERPRTGDPGSGLGGNWLVIVLNDDHNTFDHVAQTLARLIPGVSVDERLPVRRPDPQQWPGDCLAGAEGAG